MSDDDLDLLPAGELVGRLLAAEERVLPAVRGARAAIAAAAELIALRMGAGGKLVLLGAGTSGRLAVVQAAELPGTFGLATGDVAGVCAGAGPWLMGTDMDEDDTGAAVRDLGGTGLDARGVLVAVAASGSTPYTLTAARHAQRLGVAVVAVTTVAGSPLGSLADVEVAVPVGPELLRGSTRLGAGTAQKIALDAVTTAAMARLGRVHGTLMVDVVPANAKLRDRSAGLVAEIAGCPPERAAEALARCDWNARAAVLHLLTGLAPADAARHAAAHRTLRAAIAAAGAPR
ncbi:N-acetylmuramic acid 6-phosphate etherase [Pilimelia anulata]|uniref:N-acetylmuramic acid 6-phosphate etherase n=1 Tax=Pilimelia anulata TaxID=53371 RepID=A0A8J3BBK7_9ACTN|nr:N-acetylmuramic acid 6-phosphate etherase [Pilimelia anulata]GGJ94681.1 N-acetylmuramic acid 6-phosphate etherase [Pilimelia anulata]